MHWEHSAGDPEYPRTSEIGILPSIVLENHMEREMANETGNETGNANYIRVYRDWGFQKLKLRYLDLRIPDTHSNTLHIHYLGAKGCDSGYLGWQGWF